MGAIEFLANRPQLTLLELADAEAAPPVGRADDGRVHELQHWALPEGVRDNLRATSLLEEQPFEQVRGADDAPMAEREAEVGDAGVEVVAEHGGQRRRGCLVAPARPQRDLRPLTFRRFAAEVPHPMDEAPLTERPGEARLDGTNQARRPVGHGEAATFAVSVGDRPTCTRDDSVVTCLRAPFID